ncbi:MAG: MFS transporter [Pseudomonadota bacterium]|nr:MFS transporter [Pseudomonadota bacterium]
MTRRGDRSQPEHDADNARGSVTARFALLCIGVWLHSADTLVTATIAPAIVDDLGGVAYINWTISLYEVGAIIAGAAAAVMCRRWGIKRVFVGAALLYGGGCGIAAAALDIAVLISGRLMQGMGGGMMLTLCYVAIEAWFVPTLRGRMFAIVAVVWGAGSLLGPLIGGIFADRHSWRGAFWAFAVQALVVAGLTLFLVPPMAMASAKQFARGLPVLPLAVLSAATLVIAESGALSDISSGGAAVAISGCLLGTSLLYLAARLDRHAQVRLLPAQLLEFGHPVGAGLAMVFALSVATTGFWAYGPLIVKILFGTKPLVTGYILAGEAIAWSIATLAVSSMTAAAEPGLIRCGALGVAVGAAGFAIAVPTGSLAGMVVCGLFQGTGFGLCWPAIVERTVRFADTAERSLASAAVSTVQRIGYAIGTAAAGIAANLSGLAEGVSAAGARAAGFWVFAAFVPVLAIGLVSAWRFTRAGLSSEPP